MSSSRKPWIGFDLDGTLAHYDKWQGVGHVGKPIEPMVHLLKAYLAAGHEVRILTARASRVFEFHSVEAQTEYIEAMIAIQEWCKEHIGQVLPVTPVKDFLMVELYDDRAVQVVPNTGQTLAETLGVINE